jgi:hypothetical protein
MRIGLNMVRRQLEAHDSTMAAHLVDSFVRDYVSALQEENAAVFAGAGLSIPAGMVDWRALLRDVASDIGLDVDRETDLISVAQFHVNERGGRHRINQALVTEFAERATLSENHSLLASLPIKTYWTTNYDTLIEHALRAAHKRPDVKATVNNLATTLPRRDAVVYKMHGDVAHPDSAIVTKDDYEAYGETHRLFWAALQGDLVSKTFLFVGFSFSDPNLGFVLGRIRVLLGESQRDHYCLLRKVARGDFASTAEFEYARARQDLQVRDLRRYGIHGLLLDDYSNYTSVLRRLVTTYRRGRVFVSGSGDKFAPWSTSEAQAFIRQVGHALLKEGFDLVSGFGIGVGPSLLNGALDALEEQGSYSLYERVILRPFPHGITDPAERASRWTAYRKEMLSHAGIALYLFGNKRLPDGSLRRAAGVEEEFTLAAESGLVVVPLGATGYTASDLHRRVVDDFDRYFPERGELRSDFEALGRPQDPRSLIDQTMHFLKRLRGAR